jgi:hypothetical protein
VPVAVVDAAPAPAGEPDARTRSGGRDAGTPPPRPDARTPGPTPDAAETAAKGTAYYTATATPFCLIRIDGADHGSTPKFDKAIPAGRHRFILTDPESGTVVADKTVTLEAGEHFSISR